MPNYRPPDRLSATPAKTTLPRGTVLYRVHSARRDATAFNPNPAHCLYGGGRFDGTGCDPYGYLYAGLTPVAAVCETLLRSLPFDPAGGPRLVPKVSVRGRRLTTLRLAADVTVVSLMTAQDLSGVHQDTWLVQAEAVDYAYTRDWAHWIRDHTDPWAQGFVWRSKREPEDRTVLLFGDRCPRGAVETVDEAPVDFGTEDGDRWLNSVLEPYYARLAP